MKKKMDENFEFDIGLNQRLLNAVEALATSKDEVRQRLQQAYQFLFPLRVADFPQQMREEFQNLEKAMKPASFSAMENDKAVECSKTIFRLYVSYNSMKSTG